MNPVPIRVDLWSDIQCPFCYIGKTKFEKALASFADRDRVQIVRHSYLLDPDLTPVRGESIQAYLARRKGWSLTQSRQMHDRVAAMAAETGLDYQFDRLVVANTRAAHRLLQAAQTRGFGERIEKSLFHAYFTAGRDVADPRVLADLAESAGLGQAVAEEAWSDPEGRWAAQVSQDMAEAEAQGITGVPFFVFQGQYALSGAQDPEVFLRALEKTGPSLKQ